MSEESERFRLRAKECRDIAARTPDGPWRHQLTNLAKDLDAEADQIESEESILNEMPPPQVGL
jgi:hypothetical protein